MNLRLRLALSAAAVGFVSTPSCAADTTATDTLEEVLVTARFRSEALSTAPLAITAFGAQWIEDAGMRGVGDFLSLAPNVRINQAQNAGTGFVTIRGISQVRNGESPIAVLVDGVEQVNARQFTQTLYDAAGVEVLRGPAGALFGRNAIGGAVVIHTKQPTETVEGMASASIGRGGDGQFRAALAGPLLGDRLLGRISGSYRDAGGYYRNLYLDRRTDGVRDLNLRGQLHAILSDAVTADLRYSHGDTDGGALNYQYQSANFDPANPCHLDPANPLGGPAPDADKVVRHFCATNPGENRRKTDQLSLTLTYATDAFTVTNVAAYDRITEYVAGDQFPYTADVDLWGMLDGTQTQFEAVTAWSDELRILSPDTGRFRWMAGAYFLATSRFISTTTGDDNLRGITEVTRTPAFSDPDNPTTSYFADDNDNRAVAVFGNIAYDLTEGLEAAAALRYDRDRRDQFVLPEQSWSKPAGCAAATPDACHKKRTDDRLQPKFTLTWKAANGVTLYGSWGIGFRSGQFNQSGVSAIAEAGGATGVYDEVKAEVARTFETGFKTRFLDGKLRLDGAIFTTSDRNPLYFVFIGAVGAQVLVNIDRVRNTGFELEAAAQLAPGLEAFANFGHTKSRIRAYDVNPAAIGNAAPYVPETSGAAGLQYRGSLNDNFGVLLHADVEHHGKQYWDPENSSARSSYELVNLRAGIEAAAGWSLTGSLRNAFDKKYNSEWVLGGFAHPGLPRSWSIELAAKF